MEHCPSLLRESLRHDRYKQARGTQDIAFLVSFYSTSIVCRVQRVLAHAERIAELHIIQK